MDGYEATRIVFSRIQNLDPENASKIMGLLLIQDHGEKEMIRLAFGPESLVHSVIIKARKELGFNSSSTNLSSSPSSPSPMFGRQGSATSRLGVSIPNPSWSEVPNTEDLVNSPSGSSSSLNPASLPFYGNGGVCDSIDEFHLQDQLSFFNENSSQSFGSKDVDLGFSQLDSLASPTGGGGGSGVDPMLYWNGGVHRRSCSVSDVLGSEDPNSGFGWRPCLYFARGFCKNGGNCRFVHGGPGEADGSTLVGSPSKVEMMDQCHELRRSKFAHRQRLAAVSQLLGSGSGSGSGFPCSPKSINFLLQQQQNDSQRAAAAAATLMMGEEMNKFGRARLDRNDLISPASRQIYLTFPADSTFREEDVSIYFSIYGPVQDVRIPYQQKRMFGFVTFVYPETVKMILAKGNPHFVCDARVLVKPYKEKGKIPDKKQSQQMERGEFSPCGTPTGLDSRDPLDLHGRMFYNNQDLLWKKKIEEQADVKQALELQSRRLMNLQLLDIKKHHHHRALSTGSPIPSPTHSPSLFSQSLGFPPLHSSQEVSHENCSSPLLVMSLNGAHEKQRFNVAFEQEFVRNVENGSGKVSSHIRDNDLLESLEHNLPDSPFASSCERSGKYFSTFNINATEATKDATPASSSATNSSSSPAVLPSNPSLDVGSFKSFNCQLPRFSSGPSAIGMYTGTGGPTCPVGI